MSTSRRALIGALLCVLLGVVSCSQEANKPPSRTSQTATSGHGGTSPTPSGTTDPGGAPPPTATPTPAEPQRGELPGGGSKIFPGRRLVGYVGLPDAPTLGRLGTGDPDQRAEELIDRAKPYAQGRRVLPVLEIIACVVQGSPGRSGLYRSHIPDAVIQTYLAAARRHDALLLLNVQPGRSEFLDEVKYLRPWLSEPDVGLALDPEWAMQPGQVPGHEYGWTTGAELDAVARYVSAIVTDEHLPEKAIVYHQVARSVVRDESGLKRHRGVAMIKSVDGIGSRADKTHTFHRVQPGTPSFVHSGFKLFLDEDAEHGPVMTPRQVLALSPKPEYVMYE